MDRKAAGLVWVVVLPSLCACLLAKDFIRYTTGHQWNQAREVCSSDGKGTLAILNKFSMAFLRQAFAAEPLYNTDNVWIGLYDVAQGAGQLGSQGFRWVHCKLLDKLNHWAAGEPADRTNNWCVRLLYDDDLAWHPEQCASLGHFLCQRSRGNCSSFKEGCDVTSANLTEIEPASGTDTNLECKAACLDYEQDGVRCWAYSYVIQDGCRLFVGDSPVYCGTESSTATSASSLWIRDCYSIFYNQSADLGVSSSNEQHPLVDCDTDNTTDLLDDTSQLCGCPCRRHTSTDVTNASQMTQTLQELTLEKKALSSSRRRRESAWDSRASAQASGAVGVVVMVGVLGLVVASDLWAFWRRRHRTLATVKLSCRRSGRL